MNIDDFVTVFLHELRRQNLHVTRQDNRIYPVFLSLFLLGRPDEIRSMAVKSPTGSDESTSMLFRYSDQVIADLKCSFSVNGPIEATIMFEKGRVRINRMWFAPSSLTIIDEKEKTDEVTFDHGGNG